MSQNTLEVTKCADIDDLPNVYHHLNFDAQGQLLLSWSVRSGSTFLKVIGEPDTKVELKKPHLQFPMAQRFQDGRWLIADARCEAGARNAHLFSPDFQLLSSFHLGDAIGHLRVNQQDQIWVGHFDENPLGLRCYNDAGQLTYD